MSVALMKWNWDILRFNHKPVPYLLQEVVGIHQDDLRNHITTLYKSRLGGVLNGRNPNGTINLCIMYCRIVRFFVSKLRHLTLNSWTAFSIYFIYFRRWLVYTPMICRRISTRPSGGLRVYARHVTVSLESQFSLFSHWSI